MKMTAFARIVAFALVVLGGVAGCCIPLYDLPWCSPQGVQAPMDSALVMACVPEGVDR